MRSRFALVVVPLALLISRDARAGNVLKVGPGQAYSGIQPAIDAASDGDVVLVYGGSGPYAGFVVPDRSLAIVGEPGTNAAVLGEIHVEGQGARRTVVVASLVAHASDALQNALQLKQSLAAVRLQDCTLAGEDLTIPQDAGVAANIGFCSDVVFTRCTLRGGNGLQSASNCWAMGRGGDACFARSSMVEIYGSTLSGGPGAGDFCEEHLDGLHGGQAFETPEGVLFASGCQFQGGAGGAGGDGDFLEYGGNGGNGGDGIRLGSTPPPSLGMPQALLHSCTLLGGAAGMPGFGGLGSGSPGSAGLPIDTFSGSASTSTDPARRMEGPSLAREAESVTLVFHGAPGDEVYLKNDRVFSPPSAPGWMNRLMLAHIHLGTIPASGTLSWTFTVGEIGGAIQSRTVLTRPTFVDANGTEFQGNSFAFVAIDRTL
jgi:hypothetical protein